MLLGMLRSKSGRRQVVTPSEEKQDPQDYLKKSGVTRHVHAVFAQLLESRPDDPIAFLVNYFSQVVEGLSLVKQAHRELGLVHHSSPGFQNHVFKAYTIMSNCGTSSGPSGLHGGPFTELLQLLLTGVPTVFTDKLMLRIQCRDHESVGYGVFCRGVVSCLVLKDFCRRLKSLYKMLDVLHEGTADWHLCKAALKEMESSDSNHQRTTENMKKAMKHVEDNGAIPTFMSQDEFITTAVSAFIDKIQEVM